jgi:transposase
MRKQKSPEAFGFKRYDRGHLQRALKEVKDKRTFIRLKAVLLFAQGMNIQAIGKLFNKSIQIVYQWIRRYLKTHRSTELYDVPKTGRPLVAQAITDKRILKELKRNPLRLGYHTTVWTVALLAGHLNALFGSQISPRTLYRRMKQMDLRCKRPRYVYEEKDPNRTQKKGL